MDRFINHLYRFIDFVVCFVLPNDLAVDVDLYQAGSGDFLVEQAVEIEQDNIFLTRHTRGDVIVDEICHAIDVDEAITRGEIKASLPFLRRNPILDRREIARVIHRAFQVPPGVDPSWRVYPQHNHGYGSEPRLDQTVEAQYPVPGPRPTQPNTRDPLYLRSRLPISPRPRRSRV